MFIFKNFAAASLAAATFVAASLNAFAAVDADHTLTAEYKNGLVNVTLPSSMDASQWTVIVIPTSLENTFEQDDIYYINQDAGNAQNTFWTNGLGVKTDLAATEFDSFTVRMGNAAGDFYEGQFSVGTAVPETRTVEYGDVNGSGGVPDSTDASLILQKFVTPTKNFVDNGTPQSIIPDVVGDVNGSGGVPDSTDASLVLQKFVTPSKVFVDSSNNNAPLVDYTYEIVEVK